MLEFGNEAQAVAIRQAAIQERDIGTSAVA
ncbi:hypothetical protein GALL_529080 [mine drainage metagenome]|uniref:Uncharacterized protein n=1 Tax=mine drainage metagenome TaxID=410659 RepID=A0A1J5PJS0_9ZZZZ